MNKQMSIKLMKKSLTCITVLYALLMGCVPKKKKKKAADRLLLKSISALMVWGW